jgi:hypothetical protein
MNTICLSLLLLTPLHSVALGQEAPSPPRAIPTITDTAERDITLFFVPHFPFVLEDINAILQSKQFAAATIEELTGRRPQLVPTSRVAYGNMDGWGTLQGTEFFFAYVTGRRDLIRGSDGSIPLRLQVQVNQQEGGDNKVKAEKYAELVIKHLNKVLADLSRRSLEQRLVQLKSKVDEARRKVQVSEAKVEELSARLRQKSGALPEAVLHELVSDLTKQQQAIEVELAGMTGRREALQVEVAKASDRLKNSSKNDEVVRNLQRVLEIRTKALQSVKQLHEFGNSSTSYLDLAKAEEQVALAKVELDQAKRADARASDAHLEKLNDELSQVAVSIAENEAKLPFLRERLNEYEKTLSDASQTKAVREQLDYEIRELSSSRLSAEAAKENVAELESSFRPARVEIFELKPSDDNPSNAKDVDSKTEKPGQR